MNETGRSGYQSKLIKKLEKMFPAAMIIRGNSTYQPGIPDLIILNGHRWAALEVKKSKTAPARPNQPFFVAKMYRMSYAAFIYPENEKEVLDALQFALTSERLPRDTEREPGKLGEL